MKSKHLYFLFVMGAACVAAPSWADTGDTLNVSTGYSVQTDSNLFRFSSSANPQALGISKKSERVDTRYINLTLDKEYSLQRFELNARYSDNRHQNFTYLNFAGIDYAGTWAWSVTPRVRGTLSADRKEALNNFADIGGVTVRNVRTDTTLKFDGQADIGAALQALGSLEQVRRTNEVSVVQEGDSTIDSVGIGMRYVLSSGNSISYRLRKGSGDYYNRVESAVTSIPNSFDETEHELRTSWLLTSKTSLVARLSYLERLHSGVPQRNYSGPTANVGTIWNPTAKIGLSAGLSRSLSSYQTDTSSFITSNRLSMAPVWRATTHTSVRFNYDYLTQEFDGALPGLGLPANRKDITRLALVAVDWRPRQFFSMTLSLQNQKRTSNTAGFDFNSNVANIGAEVRF